MSRFIFLQCKEKTNKVTNTSFIILHSTKRAENVENHNSFGIVLIKIAYYVEEAGVGGGDNRQKKDYVFLHDSYLFLSLQKTSLIHCAVIRERTEISAF